MPLGAAADGSASQVHRSHRRRVESGIFVFDAKTLRFLVVKLLLFSCFSLLLIVKLLSLQCNQKEWYMKVIKVSAILDALQADGWQLVHQVGSHRQFKHPTKKGKVTVNGKKSGDVWGDLLKSIEKQSGLKF